MTKRADGTAAIVIYLDPKVPDDTKVTFIRYVHDHLKAKDPNLRRVRHYVCPHCQMAVEGHRAVEERLARGLKDIVCVNCERRFTLFDLIEQKFASEVLQQSVRDLQERARSSIASESGELILIGHALSIANEAGQSYRGESVPTRGIDAVIEFTNYDGTASGRRILLQFKLSEWYLTPSKRTDAETFVIKKAELAKQWEQGPEPVMMVLKGLDGVIRWMDVGKVLRHHKQLDKGSLPNIHFRGEPFTALNLQRFRDAVLSRAQC
jgi:hypothetical protein